MFLSLYVPNIVSLAQSVDPVDWVTGPVIAWGPWGASRQCAVCSVYCAMCSVYCAVWSVLSAVCSVQYVV